MNRVGGFQEAAAYSRNGITTGWKRLGRVSRDNTKERESILEKDLTKNVSLKRKKKLRNCGKIVKKLC